MAWESVSLNPVLGKDQSMKTYWKHIADHFHGIVKTPSNRSIGSLSHRWSTIQECCNHWPGCIVNVDRAQPSGVTLQDRINHIQKLYKKREPHNRAVVMLHCWMLHEHHENWINRDNDCNPLKKKADRSFSEFENEGERRGDRGAGACRGARRARLGGIASARRGLRGPCRERRRWLCRPGERSCGRSSSSLKPALW